MNFVNYIQFIKDCKDFIKNLPKFDAVSYIPTSGYIPAFIYSKYFSVPLLTLQEAEKWDNVLIFDDTVCYGRAMSRIQDPLKKRSYACVYYSGEEINCKLDYWYKLIKQPRIFEWNWMQQERLINHSCFDIDGVLCEKPKEYQNDDGPGYLKFIKNAKPKFIPEYKIGVIVTARLEKYRKETEEWLRKNRVKYKKLIMLDSTAEKRRSLNLHGKHKAKYYINNYFLFVEDEPNQAYEINSITKKPVLCISNWEIYDQK